jgi:uncharacterized protein
MKRRLVVLTGLALLLVGCGSRSPSGVASAASPDVSSNPGSSSVSSTGITVQATGQVSGTPDLLTVALGVATHADKASDALNDNNMRATSLIGLLKQRGVADRDIQTSQLSISPVYDKTVITGYNVTNMVTAKLRDLRGAGALIDAAAQAAGDAIRVQGLTFSIEDTSQLVADARKQAVTKAHDQADQLATVAGRKLGAVRSIVESSGQIYPRSVGASDYQYSVASTPIEPGSQQLNVNVTIVYELAG